MLWLSSRDVEYFRQFLTRVQEIPDLERGNFTSQYYTYIGKYETLYRKFNMKGEVKGFT